MLSLYGLEGLGFRLGLTGWFWSWFQGSGLSFQDLGFTPYVLDFRFQSCGLSF